MAWIKSYQELQNHPKTRKLSRMLGASLPAIIGHLHLLWWWALEFAKDGDISRYDAYDIADAVEWDGDPEQLLTSLIKCGFIDDNENGLSIHDWNDYGGKLLESRKNDYERLKNYRQKKSNDTGIKINNGADDMHIISSCNADDTHIISNDTPLDKDIDKDIDITDINIRNNISAQNEQKKQGYEEGFNEFWKVYPRKLAKKDALKAWLSIKPSDKLKDEIIAGVEYWKNSKQWIKDDGQFIPYPATFLRGKRWSERDMVESDPKAFGSGNDYDSFLTEYKPKLRSVAGGTR